MGVQLIVLAKEPIPGRVKTRLTPPYSPEEAAELASASIADTLTAVMTAVLLAPRRGLAVEPVLALDGSAGPWLWNACPGARDVRIIAQPTGGLDVRLAAAFDDATADSPGSAFLIGMDTPQLTPENLLDAMENLARPDTDAVLGLADDGGWWGLGLKKADASLLLGVPMSTVDTGRAQNQRLRSAGLAVGLLPVMRDIDTARDAAHVAAAAPYSQFAAAFIRMALARMAPALPVAS
jgi:rSAM/selenodomain-associated transferase 1